MQSEVPLESREAWSLFNLLLKDKSTEVSSQSSQTWQEIANVVAIFRQFGAKEQVCMNTLQPPLHMGPFREVKVATYGSQNEVKVATYGGQNEVKVATYGGQNEVKVATCTIVEVKVEVTLLGCYWDQKSLRVWSQ